MSLPLEDPGMSADVGVVLYRVGLELAALATLSEDLQDALSVAEPEGAISSAVTIERLQSMQNLDLLTQTLDALAQFLKILATEPATAATVDMSEALLAVNLSNVATRLSGHGGETVGENDFELF